MSPDWARHFADMFAREDFKRVEAAERIQRIQRMNDVIGRIAKSRDAALARALAAEAVIEQVRVAAADLYLRTAREELGDILALLPEVTP